MTNTLTIKRKTINYIPTERSGFYATELESWHWVTISALSCDEAEKTAHVAICDEGLLKQINLKLWLETTAQGGGFVYFRPVNYALVK